MRLCVTSLHVAIYVVIARTGPRVLACTLNRGMIPFHISFSGYSILRYESNIELKAPDSVGSCWLILHQFSIGSTSHINTDRVKIVIEILLSQLIFTVEYIGTGKLYIYEELAVNHKAWLSLFMEYCVSLSFQCQYKTRRDINYKSLVLS